MGRPKIAHPKVLEVKFMASQKDKDQMDKATRRAGLSRSAWIRRELGLEPAQTSRRPKYELRYLCKNPLCLGHRHKDKMDNCR